MAQKYAFLRTMTSFFLSLSVSDIYVNTGSLLDREEFGAVAPTREHFVQEVGTRLRPTPYLYIRDDELGRAPRNKTADPETKNAPFSAKSPLFSAERRGLFREICAVIPLTRGCRHLKTAHSSTATLAFSIRCAEFRHTMKDFEVLRCGIFLRIGIYKVNSLVHFLSLHMGIPQIKMRRVLLRLEYFFYLCPNRWEIPLLFYANNKTHHEEDVPFFARNCDARGKCFYDFVQQN